MKKLILVLMLVSASVSLIGISSTSVFASGGKGGTSNKIPASQVPAPVMTSFKSGFPGAQQTEWEFTPVYYGTPIYTASFKLNGQKWQANYYADGTLVSSAPRS